MNLFKEKEIFSNKCVFCSVHGNIEKSYTKENDLNGICPYCHSKLITEKEYYINVVKFLSKN